MIIDILGWAGAIIVLYAFFLINMGKVQNHSKLYQLLNVIGSLFLIIYAGYKQAAANAFVNVVWMIIAIIGLVKTFRVKV